MPLENCEKISVDILSHDLYAHDIHQGFCPIMAALLSVLSVEIILFWYWTIWPQIWMGPVSYGSIYISRPHPECPTVVTSNCYLVCSAQQVIVVSLCHMRVCCWLWGLLSLMCEYNYWVQLLGGLVESWGVESATSLPLEMGPLAADFGTTESIVKIQTNSTNKFTSLADTTSFTIFLFCCLVFFFLFEIKEMGLVFLDSLW